MIVYTVEGSEDGLVLATHSVNDAATRALNYIWSNGNSEHTVKSIKRQIREELKSYTKAIVLIEYGNVSATVTAWDSEK